MSKKYTFIAEVKTASPFGWKSDLSWEELFELAAKHGDMIAVHTDPRWGGSFELVAKARKLTKKPILAKGIHDNDELIKRAFDAGADQVLVVGRRPGRYAEHCILEPLTLQELNEYSENAKVLWNSRDLSNGGLKGSTFQEARTMWDGWLCQASNIRHVDDIEPGADAILVGTYLPEFIQSL